MKNHPELPLAEGASIPLVENSGSLQFGKTTVEALVPWERAYVPGRRYLVFGGIRDGIFLVNSAAAYEEVNATTVRRLRKHDNPDDLDELESCF